MAAERMALAAMLLFGYRLWPGLAVGALLTTAAANAPLGLAVGTAIGYPLEALVGAYLLRRLVEFQNSLARLRDVLGLTLLAGLLSTTIGATCGVVSLWLTGVVELSRSLPVWREWWLSNVAGVIVVTPPLLTWATRPRIGWRGGRIAEAGALLSITVILGGRAFAGRPRSALSSLPSLLFPVPSLVWSALRFGP